MEKILSQIKIVESEEGYRIEVSGDRAKDWMKGGCLPVACCCLPSGRSFEGTASTQCCPTEDKK